MTAQQTVPATNRPLPQLPSALDDSRDTVSPPPPRSHVPYSPDSFSGPPYHSHTTTSPPPPERISPNSGGFRNPSLDARTETEPRRSFKERLGFGSSRENLLDFPDTNHRTTGLRRKLSSRRQPPPHVLAPVERSSDRGDILQGATFDNRPLGPGTSEKEELRDLSSFLRTTAPSRDQRRPFSIVGSPSAAQPQWAAGSPESENPAVTRRARTNSLDDRVPRPDERAYGIVLPPEDDVREQDTPSESTSPVSQSQSARNPVQGISPTSGKTNDALESHLAPAQRQPLPGSPSSTQDQQLQVNELPERKTSLQQPSPFLVQQDLQGEGIAAQSDYNLPQSNSKQELSAGGSMPASLRPPSRSTSQSQTPPSTPGRVGDMSQQMQQHHQQQLASAQTISGRRTPEPPSLEREISGVDVNQSAQYRELRTSLFLSPFDHAIRVPKYSPCMTNTLVKPIQEKSTQRLNATILKKRTKSSLYRMRLRTRNSPHHAPLSTTSNMSHASLVWMDSFLSLHMAFARTGQPCRIGYNPISTEMLSAWGSKNVQLLVEHLLVSG